MDKIILRKYIILYLLIIIGIFIQFTFLGAVGNIIIKIMIISAISYFLFGFWTNEDIESFKSEEPVENEALEIVDDVSLKKEVVFEKESPDGIEFGAINENQFDFLQRQFLVFIKLLKPRNSYLCYKNSSNEIFLLKSDLISGFEENNDIIPDGVITLIDQKDNDVLIENKLDSGSSLLPFYNDKDYAANSVLGIKSPLGKSEALYWIFDADENDYFNKEDILFFKALSENTCQFLAADHQSIKLSRKNDVLNDIYHLTIRLIEADSTDEKINEFVEIIAENFEASKLTISLLKDFKTESETAVINRTIGLNGGFEKGYEFPVNEGLNGWVIMKNKAYLLDNIEKGDYFIPRFSRNEKSNFGLHSFLAVPIPYKSNAVGLVALEHKEINKYDNKDKEKLINFCSIFAKVIERNVTIELGG